MDPTPASLLFVAVAVLAPLPRAGGELAVVRRPGEHVVARGLRKAAPEAIGLSSAPPGRLDAAMRRHVDDGRLAGAATAAGRDQRHPTYAPGEVPAELAPVVARAEQALQALQTALVARLSEELTRNGPAAAVMVCRDEAQAITERVAKEQGVEIGRTSHRLRNPANAARPWANPFVLEAAARKAAEVTTRVVDLGDRVGVLRPIGTAEMCTRCHGEQAVVRPAIGAMLDAAYPQDRATGFAVGDLRGWMWAEAPKR